MLTSEAADAAEQTGGKHRAGDFKKAARAFASAHEIYTNGIARFPADTDLAYNKYCQFPALTHKSSVISYTVRRARLEVEICQQPTLIRCMPVAVDIIQFMRQSIVSSKHAWNLLNDDAEIMFNTAQSMATLAGYLVEFDSYGDNLDETQDERNTQEAISLLQESMAVFDQCLARQIVLVQEFHEMDQAAAAAAASPDRAEEQRMGATQDIPEDQPPSASAMETDVDGSADQFVSVRSATTPQDLVDTAHAMLSAMAVLLPLDDDDRQAETIIKAGQQLLTVQIPSWLQTTVNHGQEEKDEESSADQSRHGEFELAVAAKLFSKGSINLDQYTSSLSSLGQAEAAVARADFDSICVQADSRIEIVETIVDFLTTHPGAYQSGMTSTLWNILSKSQELFTAAGKLRPQSEDIMVSRADVEVLRFRLAVAGTIAQSRAGQPSAPADIPAAITRSAGPLLKNAGKLYEAASQEHHRRGEERIANFHQGSVMLMRWALAIVEGRTQEGSSIQVQLEARGTRWSRAMSELDSGLLPGVDRTRHTV